MCFLTTWIQKPILVIWVVNSWKMHLMKFYIAFKMNILKVYIVVRITIKLFLEKDKSRNISIV